MTGRRFASGATAGVGLLLLANALFMAVIANFNLGIVASATLALMLIAYGILWQRGKAPRWLHLAMGLLCLVLVSFSCFLAIYGSHDTASYHEDAVIVLGAGVRGERVTSPLALRLDAALAYHAKNPVALIVVSGGQGPQEDIPEAIAMQRYLLAKGIPEGQIITEDRSTSTAENFRFSDQLLKQRFPQGYSAVFVTNAFHVFRADRIARRAGVPATHLGAPLAWYAVPTTYMREMMAVTASLISPSH